MVGMMAAMQAEQQAKATQQAKAAQGTEHSLGIQYRPRADAGRRDV